jgi:sigma-70-like protein
MHNQNADGIHRSVREGIIVGVDEPWPVLPAATDPTEVLSLRDLDRALARIHKEQRRVLLLIGLEGTSYEEAARILDVPVGTIRSQGAYAIPIVECVLTCVGPGNWCATRPRLTASSAASRRLDLPNEGQAIDLSNFGCGQLLELGDLGIDPRHDLPRYSHCRLRWHGIRDGNGADQG